MTTRTTRTIPVIAALVFIGATVQAFASEATETPGIADAYYAAQEIRTQFQSGNVAESAQEALNILVERGVAALAESGEAPLAAQLEGEWKANFANYLPKNIIRDDSKVGGYGLIDDIGDHDALSPWLVKFHDTLKVKTGGVIDGIRIVSDIFTMNYALGVVLHPKAKSWKSGEAQEDEWEYRKHFIPMANIVTYWVVLEACNYVAAKKLPQAKQLCGTAASKLEFYMGRYWAPKLSDFVYRKANKIKPGGIVGFEGDTFFLSESAFEKEVFSAQI